MTLSLDIHAHSRLSDKKKLDKLAMWAALQDACELPTRMQQVETDISIIQAKLHDK